MEHEWRKFAIVNDTVMACSKCGDVKRDYNRPCPGEMNGLSAQTRMKPSVIIQPDKPNDYSI